MRKQLHKKCHIAALVLGGMTAPAMGDLVVYDGFESGTAAYEAGVRLDQNPNRSAPATDGAWADSWENVTQYEAVTDGLTYEKNGQVLETSGGAVSNLQRSGSVGGRSFAAQHETTAYFSALFHADSLNASAGNLERMLVGLGSSDVARMATFRIRADGQVQTDSYNTTEARDYALSAGQTYQLVGEISFGEGETEDDRTMYVNYWISPDLNGDPGEGALVSYAFQELIDADHAYVDRLTLWSHNSFSGDFHLDEIRVGSSYSSVVPEPTSMASMSLGALSLMLCRRLQMT